MHQVRSNFYLFKNEYLKNLDKINELEEKIVKGKWFTEAEKNTLIKYHTDFTHLNDLFYALICVCINQFNISDKEISKNSNKMVGLKLDSGVAEKLIEKTNELFYIYDDFKELSKLEMENSYILFFDDNNILPCPANERLRLKLSYEYNGDPRLSLVQLIERGNRIVQEARIGPEGWFAIGDALALPRYYLGADRVRRLELFRNPLVAPKPVPK